MKKSITARLILGFSFLGKTDLCGGEEGPTAAEFLQLLVATDYTSAIDPSAPRIGLEAAKRRIVYTSEFQSALRT